MERKNIAVYSGSFNPLHIGHLAIMEYLTGEMEYDMVYLVVSPQNPFKDAGMQESGKERYEAACKALERHPGLKVKADPIELDMPAPHYTIRTLDALSEREPECSFTLVIGADNLDAIRRWKDYRRILTEYGIAVYPRKGYDIPSIMDGLLSEAMEEGSDYSIRIIDAPVVEISSTEIREGLAQGRDMSKLMM